MSLNRAVESYRSSGGARIYRLPLEVFPDFWAFAHLVISPDFVALIDVGSGFGDSDDHLEAGLQRVREDFGEEVSWSSLTHILITHGHIDHFGGLMHVRSKTPALIGVHELDLKVLSTFEDRLTVISRRLEAYLKEAGVSQPRQGEIMRLYLLNKHLFSSVEVDFTYEAVGMQVGPLDLLHTPGHCPGHVVLKLDDVLFSGDHILESISPHQSPERLSLSTGLNHYLESLDKLEPLAPGLSLTLAGHEGPIVDLSSRISEIKDLHRGRLEQVLELLSVPMTVAEIADALFPATEGYHQLLAIEEAGAHVEYLEQRGFLRIENLEEFENNHQAPLRYRRLDHRTLSPWGRVSPTDLEGAAEGFGAEQEGR